MRFRNSPALNNPAASTRHLSSRLYCLLSNQHPISNVHILQFPNQEVNLNLTKLVQGLDESRQWGKYRCKVYRVQGPILGTLDDSFCWTLNQHTEMRRTGKIAFLSLFCLELKSKDQIPGTRQVIFCSWMNRTRKRSQNMQNLGF